MNLVNLYGITLKDISHLNRNLRKLIFLTQSLILSKALQLHRSF